MTKGSNASYVLEDKKLVLVSNNQLAPNADNRNRNDDITPEGQDNHVELQDNHVDTEAAVSKSIVHEADEELLPKPDVASPRRSTRIKRKPVRLGIDEG